jgi:hypothetical protein
MSVRVSSRALLLLCLTALGGCKINSVAKPTGCVSDMQCGAGSACTSGACIPRASRGTWAIELVPRSDSSAATTQIAAVMFSDGDNVLTADAKVSVTGDLPIGSALAGDSHINMTVPTAIPGHPDLQFETDWSTPNSAPPPPFVLTVPAGALGQVATFRLLPQPPRDAAQPPVTIQAVLTPAINLAPVNQSHFVTGRVVTPDPNLAGGFIARAFAGGQLVSNVDTVTSSNSNGNGGFRLEIPNQVIALGQPITIQITPAGSQFTTPRFTTPAITLVDGVDNLDLGDLNLPTVGFASLFRFKVVGPDHQPVNGATVRARTVISSDSSGAIELVRDGSTDPAGNVDLPLVPGSDGAAQSYDVSVIPPAGSSAGIACINALAITGGAQVPGGGEPPVTAVLSLPSKVLLAGTILSADGEPVSGVALGAIRTAVDPATNCASSIVAPLASTNSGPDGTFQLMVDPGTYRLDFDPPAGAAVPRLTETGVVVTAGQDATRVVQMLSGALLTGRVLGSDGKALPSAEVRFYEIACVDQTSCFGAARVEPILRADTHTDSAGAFRAVVPPQLAAP